MKGTGGVFFVTHRKAAGATPNNGHIQPEQYSSDTSLLGNIWLPLHGLGIRQYTALWRLPKKEAFTPILEVGCVTASYGLYDFGLPFDNVQHRANTYQIRYLP